MKKLNVEQLENVQGGTFFGADVTSCTPNNWYYDEQGNEYVLSYQVCYDFYLFWIKIYSECYTAGGC